MPAIGEVLAAIFGFETAQARNMRIPLPEVGGLYVLGPATEPKSLRKRRAIVISSSRHGSWDPDPGKPSVTVRMLVRGIHVTEIGLKTWDPESVWQCDVPRMELDLGEE